MWSNVHPLFLFQRDDIILHVAYSKSLQDGRYEHDLSRKSGDTQMNPKNKYVSDSLSVYRLGRLIYYRFTVYFQHRVQNNILCMFFIWDF